MLLACHAASPAAELAPDDSGNPTPSGPTDVVAGGSPAASGPCKTNDDCADSEAGPVCLGRECVPCSPETNLGCVEGEYCSPERLDCLTGCFDVSDCDGQLCNDGECTDYFETTPICNYLERGINDFNDTTDKYQLSPVNVRTLADIDRIAFGEDIPMSRCQDQNPSFPCRDVDIADDWCIEGLELSMMGFTLFSKSADPSEGCLLNVGGGLSGMDEIKGEELRSSDSWGFDTDELLQLFSYVTFDEDGNIGVVPDGYTISTEEVGRLVEGIVGVEMAAYNKGEANDTYHDNKRGITLFPTREGKVDCDFGNCPPTTDRKSSPWVELAKTEHGTLAVDIDIEFYNNTTAVFDCIDDPDIEDGGKDCGNLETPVGFGSLAFEVGVECVEEDDGEFAVAVSVTEPSFEIEGGLLNFVQDLCGFVASTFGGSTVGIIANETWCEAKAEQLDPNNIIADKLSDSLGQDLLKNLDSCPEITIGDDGSVTFGTLDTISCDDPECLGQPARVAPEVAFNYEATHSTVPTAQFVELLDDYAPPVITLASKEYTIETIDQGMGALCAMQATCDVDNMDFASLDFGLLAKILDGLPEGDAPDGQDLGELIEWLGEATYDNLQQFANQQQIQDHCVDQSSGFPELDNAQWLLAVWTAMTTEQCSDLPAFETLFPASMVELEITSRGDNVKDNYPFVDFVDPARKNWRALAGSACRHLFDKTYDPDPPSWQNCPDHQDPAYAGHRGCPCADVDIFTMDDVLEDGGRPDGVGSYRVHGQAGPGQYCDDDTATQSAEVVCGLTPTHHAQCMECGLDTNLGCGCTSDDQCQGLESNLTCIGDAGDGWGPGAQGTCLPDPSMSNAAIESLAEMPWFCLESCGAINAAGQMGCLYDQTDDVQLSDAQCVNVDAMAYDPQAWTDCMESEMFWSDDDECVMECESTADCANLGFPDDFVCDFEFGWAPGHCVPSGCQNMNVAPEVFQICERYR